MHQNECRNYETLKNTFTEMIMQRDKLIQEKCKKKKERKYP